MITNETGHVYGVSLIDELPLTGNMRQAMPSRADLEQVNQRNPRVAAGYEVLLASHHKLRAQLARVKEAGSNLLARGVCDLCYEDCDRMTCECSCHFFEEKARAIMRALLKEIPDDDANDQAQKGTTT